MNGSNICWGLLDTKVVCLALEGKHMSCGFLSMLMPNF